MSSLLQKMVFRCRYCCKVYLLEDCEWVPLEASKLTAMIKFFYLDDDIDMRFTSEQCTSPCYGRTVYVSCY